MLQPSVHQHSTLPGAGMATLTVQCAWCLRDAGQLPLNTESHGICEKHAAQVLAESRARRAVRQGQKESAH